MPPVEAIPKLVLPTEATPATREYAKQKIVLMGPAGCGKSELLAQDPHHFFIDTEGNLGHLAVKRLACRSWADLQEIYALLYELGMRKDTPFPYTGVVIDTFDRVMLHASEEVVRMARVRYPKHAHEINTLPDIGDGKMGWYDLSRLINLFLNHFEKLPCAKILVCHVRDMQVTLPTKASFTRYMMNIGGQAGDAVWAWANHVVHIRPQGGGDIVAADTPLIAYTVPTIDVQAKSHGMLVPNGTAWKLLPDRSRLDATANWQTFCANFT